MSGRNARFILRLDSGQRLTSSGATAANATYALQRPLTVFSAQVVSVTIPNSMYQITSSNNKVDTSLGTVTIPVGTYTSASLGTTLQALLVALDATFIVAYSTTMGKYTISRTGAFSLLFSTGVNAAISTARVLGYNATDHTLAASYAGDNVADLTAPSYLHVNSMALARGSGETIGPVPSSTRPTKSNVIARVPLTGVFGGMSTWEQALWDEDLSYERAGALVSEIDLYLTDERGAIIDLNGRDWAVDISLIASSQ